MRKKLSALCILLSAILAGCGNTADTSPTYDDKAQTDEPSLQTESKKKHKTTVSAALSVTESETEQPSSTEITSTEISPDGIPDKVKIILDNDEYMCSSLKDNLDGWFDELNMWFQDMDMDQDPELIVELGFFGAHEAHCFEMYKITDSGIILISIFDDRNYIAPIEFWTHDDGSNFSDENGTGFLYRLYKNKLFDENEEYGLNPNSKPIPEYVYLTPNIDGTAMSAYYTINLLDFDNGDFYEIGVMDLTENYAEDGGPSEFIFNGIWSDADKGLVNTCTAEEFVNEYDSIFENLIPYTVNVKPIKYASKDSDGNVTDIYSSLSYEEKAAYLTDSYNGYSVSEGCDGIQPLSSVIDRVREYKPDVFKGFSFEYTNDLKYVFKYSDGKKDYVIKEYDESDQFMLPYKKCAHNLMDGGGVCLIEAYAAGYFYYSYYSVINGAPMLVASSFGGKIRPDGSPEFFSVDVDNDGENEFAANCVYGGDGTGVVVVCKMIDGKPYIDDVEYGEFFKNYDFPGGSRPDILYYNKKNLYISYFNSDTPDDIKEWGDYDNYYEYPLDYYDYSFEPLEEYE